MAEVRRSLPDDLVPFWVTSNLSLATTFWQNNNSNINAKSLHYLMGNNRHHKRKDSNVPPLNHRHDVVWE